MAVQAMAVKEQNDPKDSVIVEPDSEEEDTSNEDTSNAQLAQESPMGRVVKYGKLTCGKLRFE